jgi:hypothetical protein
MMGGKLSEVNVALITSLTKITKDRQTVHEPVECACSVFTASDGKQYLQLETFGSKERKLVGKTVKRFS